MILIDRAKVATISAACLFFSEFPCSFNISFLKYKPLLSFAATKLGLSVTTGIFDLAYWKQSSSCYTSRGFLIWRTSNRVQDSTLYGDF